MITAIPPYVLLLIAIYLIYLTDCLVLLYANEAIARPSVSGWEVDFGSRQSWVGGKRIFLLNPFTPRRAIYRSHWMVRDVLPGVDESAMSHWNNHTRVIAGLGTRVSATAWIVLVILPLVMMLWGARGFLAGAAISWLSVIALLMRFHSYRRVLELSRGEFILLAFECLACPPCAVNLLRKLSLRYPLKIDLIALASVLKPPLAAGVMDRVGQQADARLVMMDAETPAYEEILAYRELIRCEHSRLISNESESA